MAEFLLDVYLAAGDAEVLEEASAVARACAQSRSAEGYHVVFRNATHLAHLADGRIAAAVTQARGEHQS